MNLVSKLIELVRRSRKRILVVGDVMVDHWVHGQIEGCQDGCPKFVSKLYTKTPGGAGNAYNSLSRWDVDIQLFGQLGMDRPNKWRFINTQGEITFRYDNEEVYRRNNDVNEIIKDINHSDGVLISDYDKGYLTPKIVREIVDTCNKYGIPCVADVKRHPDVYAGAILKGNVDWCNSNQIADVVTRGDQPPSVNGVQHINKLPPVECVNHVGAGDCFAAHLVLALVYGFSLKDAATVAHSAGRVYVQFEHNRAPHPCEIEKDLCIVINELT